MEGGWYGGSVMEEGVVWRRRWYGGGGGMEEGVVWRRGWYGGGGGMEEGTYPSPSSAAPRSSDTLPSLS